jgi:predicted ATPase
LDRIVRGRMVGRERELNQARQMWQNAVSGEGQLLLISGEPGIGKTRLMREIATQAEVSGGQVLVGECQAEGNAPYAPFAQITRRALRANGDYGMELPKQVLADLLELAPDLSIDYPGVEQNPRLGPEAEQMRLFENVVRFCETLSRDTPLLLVLEDMHWADSGSLHMLEHLARRTRQQPVMLLGTYREVELDEALPFHEALLEMTRRRLGKRVKLERLDKEATHDLLAVIFAEEITPEFLEGIYKETEGNPFFIEEVCKAMVESGEVWYEEGKWQRAPDMKDVTIPQGIKVAIQSRVSKLADETQGVLLAAGIIGREFDYDTLKKVTDKGEEQLIDCLEEAISKQLIEEVRGGSGEQFSFTHALIPATFRESISGLRRIRIHRRVATAIEELHPEGFERLAYHWGEAGDEERGLEYTIKAAEHARQAYANDDAVRLYSEALALLPEDHPERFDLLADQAAVYNVIGEVDAQLEDVEAMLVLAEKEGDDARQVDALLALANLYEWADTPKAREPAERALEIARELGDVGREGRALYYLGRLAHIMIDHEDARQYFEESIKCLRKAGLTRELIESLSYLSVMLGHLGYVSAAIEAVQEAVDLSKEEGDRLLKATNKRRLAIAYRSNNQNTEALRTAEEALKLHREVGDISGEIHALNFLGLTKRDLDMLEEAEADYLEGLRLAESINNDVGIIWVVWNLSGLYDWDLGQYEKAMDLVQDQLKTALLGGNKSLIVHLQNAKAYYYWLLGRFEEALSLRETILPDFEELMDVGLQASLLSYLGVLCAELGQFDRAHQYLEKAMERCSGIKGYLTDWDVPLHYAKSAVLEKGNSNLLMGLEHVKRATFYAREHKSMRRLGAALLIEACLHLALLEENPSHAEAALECTEGALKAIAVEQGYDLMPENFLFQHSWALRVNGRAEEADDYLRQAYERVMMVAGNISDEDLRRSYLENVRDNRVIQTAYQERFG